MTASTAEHFLPATHSVEFSTYSLLTADVREGEEKLVSIVILSRRGKHGVEAVRWNTFRALHNPFYKSIRASRCLESS